MAFNINDFIVGFDPTAMTTITSAQLAQLVNAATPSSDRGMTIFSNDTGAGDPVVPNASASGQTEWQRYLWIRQSGNTVSAYAWNAGGPNSNYVNPATLTVTSLLQWIPITVAGIGAGSITGAQIAVGTITAANISSTGLPSSILTGSVPPAWLSSAPGDGLLVTSNTAIGTGGGSQVTGTFSILTIAAGGITLANMAKQSVSGNATALQGTIVDGSITSTQLLAGVNGFTTTPATGTIGAVDPGSDVMVSSKSIVGIPSTTNYNPASSGSAVVAGDILAVNTRADGAITGFVTNRRAILTLAEPNAPTLQQVPVVAAGASVYSFVNTQGNTGFGRILQIHAESTTTALSTTTVLALTGTAPTTSNTTKYTGFGSSGTVSFLPQSATSTLIIEVVAQMSSATAAAPFIVLFNGTTPIASCIVPSVSPGCAGAAKISYTLASVGVSTLSFTVYFAINATGTAYINSLQGTSTGVAGLLASTFKVTEYI